MKLFVILFTILNLAHTYSIPLIPTIINNINFKTKTYIHLEKFNKRYNLLHIGVSFVSGNKCARYDFRTGSDQISFMTYSTNPISSLYLQIFNHPLKLRENYDNYPIRILQYEILDTTVESIDIYWGESNKTLNEIIEFEKTINKNYKLGLNDCRHYSRELTKWALNKPTPIWKLNKLFEKYKNKDKEKVKIKDKIKNKIKNKIKKFVKL